MKVTLTVYVLVWCSKCLAARLHAENPDGHDFRYLTCSECGTPRRVRACTPEAIRESRMRRNRFPAIREDHAREIDDD
jgi:hypothetical protein